MNELTAKAEVLVEALQYIQKFQGAIFVIKYGGSFMDSPDASIRTGVAKDVVFLEAVGINPVVVHGGGKAISKAMEKAGLKPNFIKGMRVTDEKTVQIVDEVLSNQINPEIVEAIQKHNGAAKGFSGRDIFKCKKMYLTDKGERIDIGYVG
ncbi:MAG TPA: acetylglutamate kinase, partial [Verrucomicrobiota bacterium]|nr:acetylglutamate kinase [Verrucomicrobiota bacterium]